MEDENYDANMDVLIDLRDSIAITFRFELLDLVDFVKKNVKLPKRVKICVFYSSPNQEFILKAYKPMAKLLNMDVEKFKDFESGINWLGFDAKQKSTIEETLRSLRILEV